MQNENETKAGTKLAASVDWSKGGEITTAAKPAMDARDAEGEAYDLDEIRLPRLAIAQGLSPQVIPGTPEYIRGLAVGDMFNDVTGEIYGTGPLTVVPVERHVTRIEFDPNDKKVPLDREVPKGDPRLKWQIDPATGKRDLPPAATEFVEFVCLLVRDGRAPEGVIVTIKTTNKQQRNAATLWTTYVQQRNAKIYTGAYSLVTMIARGKNRKGEDTLYGHFVVKNAGFLDPTSGPRARAILELAREFNAQLAGKRTAIDGLAATDEDAAEREAIEAEAKEADGGM